MLFRDNPVLTRELLVTLRSPRSSCSSCSMSCALGALVYFYWPSVRGRVQAGQPGRGAGGCSTSSSSDSSSWSP